MKYLNHPAIALAVLLGSIASSEAVIVATDNQISNPGFESGVLNPWFEDDVFSPTQTWAVVSDLTMAQSGNESAMIDGNNELRQNFDQFAGEVAMATGDIEILEFSFFIRHPDATANNTFVTIFYDNGSEQSKNYPTTSTAWTVIDLLPDLAAGQIPVGVSVFGNNSGRTFVDDFTLFAIPEPGTTALMMLGVAGMLFRRRRAN
jgi:hypothetical protein